MKEARFHNLPKEPIRHTLRQEFAVELKLFDSFNVSEFKGIHKFHNQYARGRHFFYYRRNLDPIIALEILLEAFRVGSLIQIVNLLVQLLFRFLVDLI